MSVEPFWVEINETALRQGDYLPQWLVPVFGSDLSADGTHEVAADEYDLIDDEDNRKGAARRRHGAISGYLLVAADGDLDLAGFESLSVGFDGLGGNRLHRQGEAGRQRRDDELAARDIAFRFQAWQIVVHELNPPVSELPPSDIRAAYPDGHGWKTFISSSSPLKPVAR